jgi:predicted DNA-binding transcriptional regulator AlpA
MKPKKKATARKSAAGNPVTEQHAHGTKKFNIDKRADLLIVAPEAAGHDDDLLTTPEVAEWLRVSSIWLEIGRSKNYGPPFQRLSATVIRYKRSAVRAWLAEREFQNTSQYKRKRA